MHIPVLDVLDIEPSNAVPAINTTCSSSKDKSGI